MEGKKKVKLPEAGQWPDKLALPDYLDNVVFAGNTGVEIAPSPEDVEGFNRYIENYKQSLPIEHAAVEYKK